MGNSKRLHRRILKRLVCDKRRKHRLGRRWEGGWPTCGICRTVSHPRPGEMVTRSLDYDRAEEA